VVENPVFVKEMRQSLFRRKPLMIAVVWTGITLGLLWLAKVTQAGYLFTAIPMLLLPMIVPAFAAGTFAKEYDQMTWQDLYLTRLTNFQVVWGKFLSTFLLVMMMSLAFIPAMMFLSINDQSDLFSIGVWGIATLLKLMLFVGLYVLMAMVCSRYSPNRRAALTWCYVSLFLYAMLGLFIWFSLESDLSTMSNIGHLSSAYDATVNGRSVSSQYIGTISLLFNSVVGVGMLVLLWVSMSEQRGYKSKDQELRAR